jgi:hypothetical protein
LDLANKDHNVTRYFYLFASGKYGISWILFEKIEDLAFRLVFSIPYGTGDEAEIEFPSSKRIMIY